MQKVLLRVDTNFRCGHNRPLAARGCERGMFCKDVNGIKYIAPIETIGCDKCEQKIRELLLEEVNRLSEEE